jgi:hypothetical protein
MRCKVALACCVALCLTLSHFSPPAQADAIRLEPLLRIATRDPAWAVAVDAGRRRLLVAEGKSVREYALLSAGTVVPAMTQAARLLGRAVEMVVEGAEAYVATQRGVCRFNTSRPHAVVCRAGFSASGLDVVGERVYVTAADADHNQCGLWVLDRALMLQGKWVAQCQNGDWFERFTDVAVDSSSAYLVGHSGGGFSGYFDGAVGVLDVSQPAEPQWNGASEQLPGLPSRIVVSDGRAYVAQQSDGFTPYLRPGLAVLGVSGDGLQPLGQLDLVDNVTSLALAAPHALVGDENGRLWAIDVSDANQPKVAAWSDTSFAVQDAAVSGAEVYLAAGEGGLVAMQMVAVPAPTPTLRLETAEGTLTPVQFTICQAGETHVLPESGVYLFSHFVPLRAYEQRYVRVWGWEVPSPECRLLNVLDIEVIEPTPTRPQRSTYLPVVRKQ